MAVFIFAILLLTASSSSSARSVYDDRYEIVADYLEANFAYDYGDSPPFAHVRAVVELLEQLHPDRADFEHALRSARRLESAASVAIFTDNSDASDADSTA